MTAIAALYEATQRPGRGTTVRAVRRAGVLIAVLVMLVAACSSGSSRSSRGSAAKAPVHTIRVVNQNLLHGNACPADSNRCDLPDRVNLFFRQLFGRDHSCPELVAIEEANPQTVAELRKGAGICGYRVVYDDDPGQDREVVLATGLVLGSERRRLAGPLRTALWVRVATNAGPVDLVATHLASSSDDRPCDRSTCPPPCKASDTLNACQGREAAAFLREKLGPHSVGVLAGDLNAHPNEPTIRAIAAAGLIDTHLATHNAECAPKTGVNCTSGRIDDSLVDMTNAFSKQTERIDYVFIDPNSRCTLGTPSGLFAAAGGPSGKRNSLVFPADHSGVIATIRCRTTPADLAASKPVLTTTTTSGGIQVTPTVRAAVTQAFTTLFAPNPSPDAQLATLENAAALRDSFIARKQQVGALADRTSVRIDSFIGSTDQTVDVTFSIMIDGNVVLDALPGQAKLVDGQWLVTTKTYCQVATLGIDTIPEACKS
jgi:endonuclease/exonuclease/phosphatase family metal-dependent hydrolase